MDVGVGVGIIVLCVLDGINVVTIVKSENVEEGAIEEEETIEEEGTIDLEGAVVETIG